VPDIPTRQGGVLDVSGLDTDAAARRKKSSKEKEEAAKRAREAFLDSRDALKQSQAELAILKETNPIRKIELEYAEKRRAVQAAAAQDLRGALSIDQQANIQRRRSTETAKLNIEEQNALREAYDKLGMEARDAALAMLQVSDAAADQNNALAGIRDGISSYLESIGTLRENISNLSGNVFKGLEDAIVSFTTTGSFNFKQFAMSVVEDLTRMVTRMLIIAPILQAIQSLLPGSNFLTGTSALSTVKLRPGGLFANGGVFDGGMVTRPTVFPFASGGAGRFGLMGEAGPEAIIPLKRGTDGRLGVAGGGGTTNVVVNVDATGSSVQGDQAQSAALGRAVAGAVQAELIKQKRPGGLLAK